MKIYMKLPGDRELCFEKEPMKPKRFEAICWVAGIAAVLWFFVKFFSLFI